MDELLKRLEPFAAGAFSGRVAEWPQLKPLLLDIYTYLTKIQEACPLYTDYKKSCQMWEDHQKELGIKG